MLERVAAALTRWCLRWVPDGYVIAGVLTAVVVGVAIPVTGKGPLEIVKFWGDGFWGFVPFTLQMAMVILTGYVVAQAPPVRRALVRIAELPATPRGAIALMALVSMSLAWVNWGLSLVGSAILATRIGRRPIGVDYRLLVATAYLGMGCVWHAGLSASAPLTSSNPAEDFVRNYLGGPVPITETLFRPFNLGLAVVVIAVMLATAVLLHPKGMSGLAPVQVPEEDPLPPPFGPPKTVAEWLERKPFVNLLFGAGLLTYLVMFLLEKGVARVNIGHVNLLFLALGVVLHWSPASFLRAAE
ncbi:MAG: short-chain fatty acid transporter, partial [Deltaproteobacteria bacterium]|nr:short-chain fatty acid transporter [Deltaproteobacteria bacterium]